MNGGERIAAAIHAAPGGALCAYLVAGYPTPEAFPDLLAAVSVVADLVEIGVPFSDPIADGPVIQEAGFAALGNRISLSWIFDLLEDLAPLPAPHLLMGYYNPFLSFGRDRLAARLATAGTAGLIVPDLTPEEGSGLHEAIGEAGVGMIRMVTPATPGDRLAKLGRLTDGFLYAVTTTGTTGGNLAFPPDLIAYLDRARDSTTAPLLAGFGVREPGQVKQLADHVDGVIVGTALIDAINRGLDPAEWLADLRPSSIDAGKEGAKGE